MPLKQPSLFNEPLTVTQLAGELRDLLNTTYSEVAVVGEVTNLKKHISGHYYFSIKDAGAVIKCKLWSSKVKRLKFDLKDGLTIIVRGQLDFYPNYGECSLIAEEITPQGMGQLELAFRQLYEKLESQGWFSQEHKKPIPAFPKHLALVTSPSGAVLHDMLRILKERWPLTEIWIVAVPVQGDKAGTQIAQTLNRLNALSTPPDLLILARGGGSMEDLWAFNEEVLAKAIFESTIPIITGIGHEPDTTIADMVADLRAPTPTAAASLAVPSGRDWHERLDGTLRQLKQLIVDGLHWDWDRLERLRTHRLFAHPMRQIDDCRQELDEVSERLLASTKRRWQQAQKELGRQASVLAALSPLQVLARGYSLTRDPHSKQSITDSSAIKIGDRIETILHQGRLLSLVESKEPA